MAKFGTILFGTDPIKYAEEAGPGAVLSTKYNYDDDDSEDGDESGTGGSTGTGVLKSITDPFGKDYSFQRIENGSRTLYPNNTFTDRTYDQWGRLETIAHKRRNPSDGSETVLQSFAYQYDNSGNITKITEANGEYTEYYYDSNLTPRYCGTVEDINGIWGVSSDDVFVAGNNGTILHYNGNLWSPMSSGTAENLRGIWGASSSDIFVVGENGAILHYDGSSWSPMTSGTTENLESVWGASGSNVYAVGTNGKILHYNGSAWYSMSSGTGDNLHSIWGASANLIFAAGYYGRILQCNNSVDWYNMSSGTTQELRAVWGTSGTDVYAVGDGEDILHYNGSSWKTTTSPVSGYLKALHGFSADNVFAAGNNGSLIHFDGSAWQQVISGFDSDIQAMHMFSATEMFMSGKEGIIRQFTGNANNHSSLNRLTMERRRTAGGNVIYCIEYLFDNNQSKNGNIHKVVYDNTNITEFTYNEMNELTGITHPDTSTETLTYDNNGNLTQTVNNTTGETTAYEWDCFDRMTKVTLPNNETVEFSYDEYGLLTTEKSEGTERSIYQHRFFETREMVKKCSSEWEVSRVNSLIKGNMSDNEFGGNILGSYIFATSTQKGSRSDAYFYHYNHLGSVSLVTDIHGNIIDSVTTDAYGNPIPQGAKVISGFNYIGTFGIKYVRKIKLHNMRARWFNSSHRRFISFDLLNFYNRYSYVSGNPVTRFDPFGLQEQQSKIIKTAGDRIIPHQEGWTLGIPAMYFGGANSEQFKQYSALFEKAKTDFLTEEDKIQLRLLIGQAFNEYALITTIRRPGAIKIRDIYGRANFIQNCVGLAFGGPGEDVYINQRVTGPIFIDNYSVVLPKKTNKVEPKEMERGDVVLFNTFFYPGHPDFYYDHVATVAEVDKECNKVLFYERDGYLAIYLSLLSHIVEAYPINYYVFRPGKRMNYSFTNKAPGYSIFAYEAFLKRSYWNELKYLTNKKFTDTNSTFV